MFCDDDSIEHVHDDDRCCECGAEDHCCASSRCPVGAPTLSNDEIAALRRDHW